MPITLFCPNCSRELKLRDEARGRHGKCPHCKATIAVPEKEPFLVREMEPTNKRNAFPDPEPSPPMAMPVKDDGRRGFGRSLLRVLRVIPGKAEPPAPAPTAHGAQPVRVVPHGGVLVGLITVLRVLGWIACGFSVLMTSASYSLNMTDAKGTWQQTTAGTNACVHILTALVITIAWDRFWGIFRDEL